MKQGGYDAAWEGLVLYRLHPAQEDVEQVEQELEEDEPSEPPPMLKVLSRRSTRAQEHFGQAGFLAWELRSNSSKRWRHLGHSNSYIGMTGLGMRAGCRVGSLAGLSRGSSCISPLGRPIAVESAIGDRGRASRDQKHQEEQQQYKWFVELHGHGSCQKMERATGLEPATSSLGSWCSTIELRPLGVSCRWLVYALRFCLSSGILREKRSGVLC